MITSRRERIQIAMELIRGVHFDEMADGIKAKEINSDPTIVDEFFSNAENLDDALAALEQVR